MADVFISYSRTDQPFVRRVHAALEAAGVECWVDWEGIPPTAEWVNEVEAAIEGADSFLFVISPDSAQSPVCAREIEHAATYQKRLVPLLRRPVDADAVPEPVRFHNWILARDDDDFDTAMATLNTALHLDLDWVHEHTRLLVRALEWDRHDRDDSFVLRGRDLQEADRQLSLRAPNQTPTTTPLQTEYLGASHHAATRSTRLKLGALTMALVVSIGLGIIAWVQRQDAQNAAAVAQSRSLVSAAGAALPTDPELSLLLARKAIGQSSSGQAVQVLREALDDSYVRQTIGGNGPAVDASFSPDGRRVLVTYSDGTALVWDRHHPSRPVATLKREKTVTTSAAFSPDGRRVVIGSDDGVASIWDLADMSQPPTLLSGHSTSITSVAFSPDGTRIVTASTDGTARVWSSQGGPALVVLAGHAGTVNDAQFSPDGNRVLTAGADGTARVWDAAQGGPATVVLNVNGPTGTVTRAHFSPDGSEIVTASTSLTGSPAPAEVWAATGQLLLALQGEAANVNDAEFSPDGTQIVTAGIDSTVRLWEATQPRNASLILLGHQGPVASAVFSPDGANVVSASNDGTVRIWDVRPNGLQTLLRLGGAQHTIFDAVISRDGRRVATASNDGIARVSTFRGPPQPQVELQGHSGPVLLASFNPNATRLATASADGTARIWDLTGATPPLVLRGHTGTVNAVDFSRDGRRVVTAGADGTARIWDATTGAQLFRFPVATTGAALALYDVSFSPDGRQIAVVGQTGLAQLWDATRASTLPSVVLRESESATINSVIYTPDGTRVLTAADNGTAEIWGVHQPARPILTLVGHVGYVNDAEASRDGRRIVTAGGDGTTRIWDAHTGVALSVFTGQAGQILSATFTPDGRNVLSASNGGTVDQWSCELCVPTPRLLQLAKQRSSRKLTSLERRLYVDTP